jgi:competence protein ComEA
VEAVCTACHTLERVVAKHGTKTEWQDKVLEMLQEDPDVTQQERDRIVEYLAAHFRPLPKINVNKVVAKEFVEALEISVQDADAIVRYREENGSFKTMEDLKKVPGLDAGKIEAHRDRLEFGTR